LKTATPREIPAEIPWEDVAGSGLDSAHT